MVWYGMVWYGDMQGHQIKSCHLPQSFMSPRARDRINNPGKPLQARFGKRKENVFSLQIKMFLDALASLLATLSVAITYPDNKNIQNSKNIQNPVRQKAIRG